MRLAELEKVQEILNRNGKGHRILIYHRNPHQYKVILKDGSIGDSLKEILALDKAPFAELTHKGLELS